MPTIGVAGVQSGTEDVDPVAIIRPVIGFRYPTCHSAMLFFLGNTEDVPIVENVPDQDPEAKGPMIYLSPSATPLEGGVSLASSIGTSLLYTDGTAPGTGGLSGSSL